MARKGKEMMVVRVSEVVAEMKPVWAEFIVNLGYTKKQGKKFAEGYVAKLMKLPLLEKLRALKTQYGPCMTAGFNAVGIDEDEAFEKAKSKGLA